MVTDITDSKDTDEERNKLLQALNRRVKELTILNEFAQIATESLKLNRVSDDSLDKVIELMAVETAAVLLTNESRSEVTTAVRGGTLTKFLDGVKKLPSGNSITSRLALSDIPIVVGDISKHPQLADTSVREEGLKSIAAVSLRSNGKVICTLIVASHDLHSFNSEDIHLQNSIGEGLGPVLKNAGLYDML